MHLNEIKVPYLVIPHNVTELWKNETFHIGFC